VRQSTGDSARTDVHSDREMVEGFPGLVVTMDMMGHVELFSSEVLEYFGKTREELRSWQINDAVHPDDLPRVIAAFTESVTTGKPYSIEHRCRRADGVYRWFQIRALAVRNDAGEITGWYVVLTDIDDLKRAENALRASERTLTLTINTIPALAWSASTDGRAEFFNQHYLNYIGLSAEQASGWGWTAAVHPDDLNDLTAAWQRIMTSEELGEAEARLRRHDGEYRWFLFRASPLRDEKGNIVKWYGVNTDIEDRKQAEGELRQAHGRLAEAQRLSKTGSFVTDLQADRNWSDEAYRIFEIDPATKVTVQAVRELVHAEDRPSFDAAIARITAGLDVDYVFRVVTRRGVVKHVRTTAHVVEEIPGRPLFVGAVQDVTESKIAEEALNRARSELARVSRVTTMSTLTASMAHEVNQPLSGIITNASTCLRMLDADPPNLDGARETARRTIRDGNRASDVITRLRALFSNKEFTLEPLDLNEVAREVIALSLSELQRNRVVLQSELADDLPRVNADRVQLQQVILNLLRNASDAMAGIEDRPRKLMIRTERDGKDRVCVIVRDAGVGVDARSLNKLFDAFYTTKSDGMGVGLSVSRSIIERHHGRLWAEPNDGPGATFLFSIPRG
jgi:PAS domain S-box-containing protein